MERSEGDVTSAYANTDKANKVLGWKTVSTLEEAISSAWKWEQKIRISPEFTPKSEHINLADTES